MSQSLKQSWKFEKQRLTKIRRNLELRAKIIDSIRAFFKRDEFLEVETPLRISAPAPEFNIDPEPSGARFLIASPELQMKRLMAQGHDKIFQICKCFRRGERGTLHQPEFTMIEWYRRGGEIEDLMIDCEEMINQVSKAAVLGQESQGSIEHLNLQSPWEKIEVADAFERFAGWRPDGSPDPDRFDMDLVEKVEPSLPLDRPVFLTGYPAAMASLARIDPKNKNRALRFELYAGGLELANGFSELTSGAEQRLRFEAEESKRRAAGKLPYPTDETFLQALDKDLAPCAGIALGIDRLVMLLVGAKKIDEVIAFPNGTA